MKKSFDFLLRDKLLMADPAFTYNDQHRMKLKIWQLLNVLN
jgi:hypothetical protein